MSGFSPHLGMSGLPGVATGGARPRRAAPEGEQVAAGCGFGPSGWGISDAGGEQGHIGTAAWAR